MDLLAEVQFTLAGANWQRSGGKGPRPQRLVKPTDRLAAKPIVTTGDELAARKKAHRDEMALRRTQRKAR